jgi:hypothetical protein
LRLSSAAVAEASDVNAINAAAITRRPRAGDKKGVSFMWD